MPKRKRFAICILVFIVLLVGTILFQKSSKSTSIERLQLPEELTNLLSEEYIKSVIRSSHTLFESSLIDTSDFIHYVIPPTVNASDDVSWRESVRNRYKKSSISQKLLNFSNFIDSCEQINNELKRWFKYGRVEFYEDAASYEDLSTLKKGSCIGMTNLAVYTFRALGVPISIDMVPNWGNINSSGHQWNVLITRNKKIPFMGAESDMLGYQPLVISKDVSTQTTTFKIPPKVYRECSTCPARFLWGDKSVIDVTDEYFETNTIHLPLSSTFDNIQLSVFSKGEYVEVADGIRKENQFIFTKMSTGILYFPVISSPTGRDQKVGYPVYLTKTQEKLLKPRINEKINMKVAHLNSLPETQMAYLTKYGYDEFEKQHGQNTLDFCPKPAGSVIYNLYMWDQGWQKIQEAKKREGTGLTFHNVPTNAAYIVVRKGEQIINTRPFVYENNVQIWL
ncbi:hypothetical protein M1D52_02435 [Olivibacter sp. SA151]|uniref:hypothetical protein n=1 Tax=Olivibacter jilunii TaxID=985016 RepID=UPI003F180701